MEYECCICKEAGSFIANDSNPIDPCALVIVAHIDKPWRDQKEQIFYCHFQCFRGIVGDHYLYIAEQDFSTNGEGQDETTEGVEPQRVQETNSLRALHHVSLPVRDLERSKRFYGDVLKLDAEVTPSFSFPLAWYKVPSGQQLHLIYNPHGTFRNTKTIEPRDTHFAFHCSASRWHELHNEFIAQEIPILTDPFHLGFLQFLTLDPDDHIVEINAF